MTERFSDREGYRPPAAPITIREDAPPALRGAILVLAKEAGMTPSTMRDPICQVLSVSPTRATSPNTPNIWNQVIQELWDYAPDRGRHVSRKAVRRRLRR